MIALLKKIMFLFYSGTIFTFESDFHFHRNDPRFKLAYPKQFTLNRLNYVFL